MNFFKTPSPLFLFILLTFFINSLSAQVGFNNPNPHPSSLVDLTAYDKGLLTPRMTSLQRIAISNPANGLMVFDTNLNAFCEYDTISNPDKWTMLNPWKADAQPNANVTLATTGNVGIGIANPTQKLEVVGSITANTATFTGTVTANTFVGNGVVPYKTVVMWYGNVSTIPAGWVLCDGANGTPDLRGRFVVGYDNRSTDPGNGIWDAVYNSTVPLLPPTPTSGAPNGSGGEKVHLLTAAESGLPSHTHTSNPHAHDIPGMFALNATNQSPYGVDTGERAAGTNVSVSTSSTTVTINPIAAQTAAQPHENRPPFFVLMYIMKQ